MTRPRWCAAIPLVFLVGPLAAQAVRIRAVEEGGRRPAAGALVSLRGDQAEPLAQALTDPTGRAILPVPRPGRYFVHLDRIGYRGTTIGPILVAAGDTVAAEIVAPSERVTLPDLTVMSGGEPVCRLDPKDGALVARLWSEARKALVGSELTSVPPLDVTRYRRGYAPGSAIVEESSTRFRTDSLQPFIAAAPERFRRAGYLEETGGGTTFLAPDAKVLLSEEFLADHCFHVAERSPTSPLIGLAFEPAEGRTRPDVAGTLWLDRRTAELRHIEFQYRNLKKAFRTGNEGGRIDYVRLPSGGWIVGKWRVRVAWHERGGEVAIVGADGLSPRGAVLVGRAFDSLSAAPLAGAIVSVAGGAYVDTTDAAGEYRLEIPTEGDFSVAISHPLLRLIGWTAVVEAGAVIRGQEVRVDFAGPGPLTVASRLCSTRPIVPETEAVIVGQVTDSTGEGRPGEVTVAWTEPTVLRAGYRVSIGEGGYRVTVSSDLEGRFRVCGIPAGVDLDVTAAGRGGGPSRRITARPGEIGILDLPAGVP